MKKAHAPPVCSLRNQSERSGEQLLGCRQTETHGTELVDMSLETKPKIWPRFRMNRNLEVGLLEVYQEHPVPLSDRPQHRCYGFHLELCQRDKVVESRQINDGPPAPPSPSPSETVSCRNPDQAGPQVPESPSGESWRPPTEVILPEPIPGSRTETPEGPATQVGDDERVLCNHP